MIGKVRVLAPEQSSASAKMSDGQIQKVDKATKQPTVKHGEIKNLEMPELNLTLDLRNKDS